MSNQLIGIDLNGDRLILETRPQVATPVTGNQPPLKNSAQFRGFFLKIDSNSGGELYFNFVVFWP